MKSEITFEERKVIQLEMLKEIDAFCRVHEIKYSLAFGTLLGAIRHNGFIPWDDDVDIMMPLPDMLKFKELFKSDNLKYCDIDTEKHYEFGFSRIAHLNTFNKIGLVRSCYGICIDLYPIIGVPSEKDNIEKFFKKASYFQNRRLAFMKWQSRAVRYLPVISLPGFDNAIRDYRDFMYSYYPYESAKTFYIIAGPFELKEKMIYNFDLFDELTEVVFENNTFLSTSHFDDFLSMRYGDYMTPPPEDQRHPYHGGHYYWK